MGTYKHTRTGTVVAVPDGGPSDTSMDRDRLWDRLDTPATTSERNGSGNTEEPVRPDVPVDEDGWRNIAADLDIDFAEIREAAAPHGASVRGYADVADLDADTQTAVLDALYPEPDPSADTGSEDANAEAAEAAEAAVTDADVEGDGGESTEG